MRKTIILAVLATSVGFAFAAQAHDHRKSSDDRATERTEYNGSYRSQNDRREYRDQMSPSHEERGKHRNRVSRSPDERGDYREDRRHRDRDDMR